MKNFLVRINCKNGGYEFDDYESAINLFIKFTNLKQYLTQFYITHNNTYKLLKTSRKGVVTMNKPYNEGMIK